MAKVYSWEVSTNPYKYAYIVHPDDTSKAYVGDELNSDNLQKVTNWVAECSDEDYIVHFEMVKKLCKENNYSVKFENVNAYMDVDASCDNLRGPAGRGIDSIVLDEDSSSEFVDIYIINYTDGTKSTFEVRHGKPGGSGGGGNPDTPEDPGDVSVSTYFAMIYTSGRNEKGEISDEVTTPIGGRYDWDEYKLKDLPTGWQEHDSVNGGNALEPPVWMSTRTFVQGHDEVGGWSTPTMISGKNGNPGVDSEGLEFIYKQSSTAPDLPEGNDKDTPGYVPKTEGWNGSPKGVDENNRTEWFATRKYDKETKKWGDWEGPARWSQYGVNGQDGDGVEYIYYLSDKGTPPENPTPSSYNEEGGGDNDGYYHEDEWLPSRLLDHIKKMNPSNENPSYETISGKTIESAVGYNCGYNWTDNPTSVDSVNQWEYVAVRKYTRTEEGTKKKWGKFSDPSLWSKYGETGQPGANATTIRKVYKITDSTSQKPAAPTNISYSDWNDTFPVDYEIDKCVWCCEAEIWAHENKFVERYRRVSKEKKDENNKIVIVPPSDATTENTLRYDSLTVPEKKITSNDGEEYKYLQIKIKDNEGKEDWGHYYEWKGGWSEPYLVTGTKGASATPMDYVTYVFRYYDRNISPEAGETGGELKNIITNDENGWCDFPDVKIGTDGPEKCWYQCCLSMYSNNTIKSWGGIHPCNGKDGNALPGKYTEFRFKVTDNKSNVPVPPTFTNTDKKTREPNGWVATNEENFPSLYKDQTMWQIFAVIDFKDGKYVLDGEWKGPIQVSAENGKDSDKVGPAGKQGVSGIPGANFKVKYCLGTFSEKTGECYWKLDDLSTSAYTQIIEYANVLDNVGKIVRLTKNSIYLGKTYYAGYYYIKDLNNVERIESFDTYSEIIEYAKVSNNVGKTVRLTKTSIYDGKTYYAGCYYIESKGVVEQIKEWDNKPAVRERYGSGYFGKDPSKLNDLKSYNYWFDFPPNSEIIKFDQPGFTGTTEDNKVIDYKQQAYEGRVIRRKFDSNRYALSFIYYHEEAKVYTNRDITTTTLTLEEAENFHVYVWCVQGTEKWKKGENKDNKGELIDENIPDGIEWGIPFKLQGTNGLNGLKGADGRSQTVYPMGIYNSNEVYLTTESKAPYVYDANDSNFYVLNQANQPWVGDLPEDYESVIIHPSTANTGNTDNKRYKTAPTSKTKEFVIVTGHTELNISGKDFYYQWSDTQRKYVPVSYYKYAYNGQWIVDQNKTTPSQNYQKSIANKHEPAWVKFESFDALYTSIGIIENGMIGSAVYNNEFMFSQQGIDESGYTTDYATESAKGNGGFLSGYEYDKEEKKWKYKGTTNKYISDGEVNPYEMKVTPTSTTPVHSFRPNITLNFKTGQAYLSTGEITFGNGVMTADTGIFRNVVINGTYNRQITHINSKSKDFDNYMTLSYIDTTYNNSKIYSPFLLNVGDVIFLEGIDGTISFPYMCPYFDTKTNKLAYLINRGVKKEKGKTEEQMTIDDLRSLIGRQIYIFSGIQSGHHNQAYITGSPVVGKINETGDANSYHVVNPYADCNFNDFPDLETDTNGIFTIKKDGWGNLIGYPIEENIEGYPSITIKEDKCILATCVLSKYYYKFSNKVDIYSTDMITWVFQELTPFYETSYGKTKITKEIYAVEKDGNRYNMYKDSLDRFTIEDNYSWTDFMTSRYNGTILHDNNKDGKYEKYEKYKIGEDLNIKYFDIDAGKYKQLYRDKVYSQNGSGYVEKPGDAATVGKGDGIPIEDKYDKDPTDKSTGYKRYYIIINE